MSARRSRTTSSFTVVLKNVNYSGEQSDSDSDGGISGGLNEAQQDILKLLAENPTVTTKSAAGILDMPIRSLERHIETLKKAGLIEREGAKKRGRWVVK